MSKEKQIDNFENEERKIENIKAEKSASFSDDEKNTKKTDKKSEKNIKIEVDEGNDDVAEIEVSTDEEENIKLGVSEEYAKEKIKEVLKTQTPKRKRKSTIINLCLLLVNLIFMFYIVKGLFNGVDESSFSSVIKVQGKKLWWLAGGVGMYVAYILVQVIMYFVLIKDITGKKRFGLAYDVALVGKYYDNVTPFAVGGQPMQIVRLAKNGISAGVSTSIPIIKMMFNSAVNMIIATIFFIFGIPNISFTTPLNNFLLILLIILGVIGLVITILVVLFTFLIASGSLITRSFISNILRIGYKLKIVKNYRQSFQKILNQVSEYKVSFRFMWKNKKTLFKILGLCVLESLTIALMPYFVVKAFAGPIDMNAWLFLIICVSEYYLCSMASSFIPLPGGTGIMEISFIFLFGIIVGDFIVWALLAWRIISYYMILVHGFTHELFVITNNFIKAKRERIK